MCGRLRLPEDYSEIKIDLGLRDILRDSYQPRWNVPPTSEIPVIISKDGVRSLVPMRWGLIPYWAKDLKIGYSTFNARSEDVDSKPVFRDAWKLGKRCLIVAEGFYEWRRGDKQPYAVALGNRGPMVLAGLWDEWRSPAGERIKSCTILVTEANELLSSIHDRMPVIISADDYPAWLGEIPATSEQLKAMLRPFPSERLSMWPVDRRVGNVRNEGPELAERIGLPDDAALSGLPR